MQKLNLPNSIRKYIRSEKNRIRKTSFDSAEQKKLIDELYARVIKREADPISAAKTAEAKGKPKKAKVAKKGGEKAKKKSK